MDLGLLVRTIRHLKAQQIGYQLYYRIKANFGQKSYTNKMGRGSKLRFASGISWVHQVEETKFTFLNIHHDFAGKIDWNYSKYGKLWTYNLNYFDFLHQEEMTKEKGLRLISDFVESYDIVKDGKEPYPTSLRIINWIKFVSRYNIQDSSIEKLLGVDSTRLKSNLEFHLLANHLLENAFALLFSSYYFRCEATYTKAKGLLLKQLDEQILADGAHYELSPTYHQLMLYRVLDSLQLVRSNNWQTDNLEQALTDKAAVMLSWLRQVTFSNGDVPLVNDAAKKTTPSTMQLFSYAERLGLQPEKVVLGSSGYRMYRLNKFEVFCDVAEVSPQYQPGHTHADVLGCIVYSSDEPFLVEAGTATYDSGQRRTYERSTSAHNTVQVGDLNSIEVWSSFRVADRPTVRIVEDRTNTLIASHDGYGKVLHERRWQIDDGEILVDDLCQGDATREVYRCYWHLHPDVAIVTPSDDRVVTSRGTLVFADHKTVVVEDYDYAEEFNQLVRSKVIVATFDHQLSTRITR